MLGFKGPRIGSGMISILFPISSKSSKGDETLVEFESEYNYLISSNSFGGESILEIFDMERIKSVFWTGVLLGSIRYSHPLKLIRSVLFT